MKHILQLKLRMYVQYSPVLFNVCNVQKQKNWHDQVKKTVVTLKGHIAMVGVKLYILVNIIGFNTTTQEFVEWCTMAICD